MPRSVAHTAGKAALPWLLCVQFFVAEQIARAFVRGPYSMAHNMISDLGALHSFSARAAPVTVSSSPMHALMNASFVLQGLLIIAGSLLLRHQFASRALVIVAFASLALAGVGVLVVGLAPEDGGGALHVCAAVVHFLAGGLGMLLLGMALLRTPRLRLAAGLSLAAGGLTLLATALLGFSRLPDGALGQLPLGAVERLAAYPLPVWLTVAGYSLLTASPLQGRPGESCSTSV